MHSNRVNMKLKLGLKKTILEVEIIYTLYKKCLQKFLWKSIVFLNTHYLNELYNDQLRANAHNRFCDGMASEPLCAT